LPLPVPCLPFPFDTTIPRLDVLVRFAYLQSIAALTIRLYRSSTLALSTNTLPARTCAGGARQSNLGAPFDQAELQSYTRALHIQPIMLRSTRCSQSLRFIDTGPVPLWPCSPDTCRLHSTCDSPPPQQNCMKSINLIVIQALQWSMELLMVQMTAAHSICQWLLQACMSRCLLRTPPALLRCEVSAKPMQEGCRDAAAAAACMCYTRMSVAQHMAQPLGPPSLVHGSIG
jgi:hypothetical protein